MKVHLSKDGVNPEDVLGKGLVADFVEHTNRITGKPDPWLVYEPGFFVCMSTAHARGYKVLNAETGEVVTVENLSPN